MPSYPGGVGLLIGIPHDGKPVTLQWAFHLANMHPPMNYEVRYHIQQNKPVAEARELIAEQAIKQNVRYLFFNDTDVTIPAHAIRQLIFHLEHHPKYAIAGAIYCHKSPPQNPMVFRGNGLGPYWDWKVGEVFDVSGIGMGATLIRVEAFKNLPKPWFKTVDDVTPWMDGICQASLWTEDLWFCKRLEEAGWGIMADGGLLCQHWDNMSGVAYSLPLNSKPYIPKGVLKGDKKIVDLGCGPIEDSYRTNEGEVLRVDIREEVKPDYRCDIRVLPFANGEFDVVFSSHTLEHFTRFEVGEVLDEWIRILKPDGELRLVMPNMEWAARHIVNKEIDVDVMNVLYGAQTYNENFHKAGYTPQMLEQLLANKGFKKFMWDFENYHMLCRAWRNPPDDIPILNPVIAVKEDAQIEVIEHDDPGDEHNEYALEELDCEKF